MTQDCVWHWRNSDFMVSISYSILRLACRSSQASHCLNVPLTAMGHPPRESGNASSSRVVPTCESGNASSAPGSAVHRVRKALVQRLSKAASTSPVRMLEPVRHRLFRCWNRAESERGSTPGATTCPYRPLSHLCYLFPCLPRFLRTVEAIRLPLHVSRDNDIRWHHRAVLIPNPGHRGLTRTLAATT